MEFFFLPIASASDDNSLSSNQDINQFLVYVDVDVTQLEHSNNKCYASIFRYIYIHIYIYIFIYKYWFHLLNLIYFIVSSKLWKSWFYCGMLMTFHIKFHLTFFFLMYILTQEEHFKENSSPSREFSQIIKVYLITC